MIFRPLVLSSQGLATQGPDSQAPEGALWDPMNAELWRGRIEPQGKRYFQSVQKFDWQHTDTAPSVVLLGFACDEGVRRNFGRVGASRGPDAFRRQLARLPFRLPVPFYDAGNINCHGRDLEASQASLQQALNKCMGHKRLTLLVGGGHEIAFGHYLALADHCRTQKKRLGIINFDAHFDLRMPLDGAGNSGTPFFQIAADAKNRCEPFSYLCLGIQPLSNHDELFERAQSLGTLWIDALSLQDRSFENEAKNMKVVLDFMSKVDALYLTVCLDVFHQSVAPGVSAPQALGIFPETFLRFARVILNSGKLLSLDFAELNPVVESPNHGGAADEAQGSPPDATARLAAALAATLLEWKSF